MQIESGTEMPRIGEFRVGSAERVKMAEVGISGLKLCFDEADLLGQKMELPVPSGGRPSVFPRAAPGVSSCVLFGAGQEDVVSGRIDCR